MGHNTSIKGFYFRSGVTKQMKVVLTANNSSVVALMKVRILVLIKFLRILLRTRRNEKEFRVKPATSFKYFQYLLTKKIKTKFKTEKI